MSQDLMTPSEVVRRTGLSKKLLLQMVDAGHLKVVMRGKTRLISLSQAKTISQKRKNQAIRKGAEAAQRDLVSHLKESVEHLRKENKELREERRMAQDRADRLLLEVHRLSLEPPKDAETIDVRQGATGRSEKDGNEEDFLENLCRDIDSQRGVDPKVTRPKKSFWGRIMDL